MTTLQSSIKSYRKGVEVYTDAQIYKEKSMELMLEPHLPHGLLPLPVLKEVGYNCVTGFVWQSHAKMTDNYFKKIKKPVSYAPEVTTFIEDQKMKRMTDMKRKELLIWVSLFEMYIDNPASGKITFKTPSGLSGSFQVDAFMVDQRRVCGVLSLL